MEDPTAPVADEASQEKAVAGASSHDWRPDRFMVIVAHPDDADFGPAATAARWIDAGSVGWLVCCTSGDAGGEDPDIDPLELAAVREDEQRAAAAVVGYAGVSFLHQPDGALANDLALREHLVREIRTFRPDAVLTSDPEVMFYRGGGVNHTDHRAAGIAAVDAVYPAARNPMSFPWLARVGPDGPCRSPPVPVLDRAARCLGRRQRDDRPQGRCPAGPRLADPRARQARRAHPIVGGRGRRVDRRRRRPRRFGSSSIEEDEADEGPTPG